MIHLIRVKIQHLISNWPFWRRQSRNLYLIVIRFFRPSISSILYWLWVLQLSRHPRELRSWQNVSLFQCCWARSPSIQRTRVRLTLLVLFECNQDDRVTWCAGGRAIARLAWWHNGPVASVHNGIVFAGDGWWWCRELSGPAGTCSHLSGTQALICWL